MIYSPSRTAWWLLSCVFCFGSCASSPRVSALISPSEGARVVLMLPDRNRGHGLVLALVNRSEDPEIKKGYQAGLVKEIDDMLMALLITELENKGFMKRASRGKPSYPGRRLVVHLDEGSFHLAYEVDHDLYHRCYRAWEEVFNRTVAPVASGNIGDWSPVDFEAQQRRLQRMNTDRRRRAGERR